MFYAAKIETLERVIEDLEVDRAEYLHTAQYADPYRDAETRADANVNAAELKLVIDHLKSAQNILSNGG